MAARIDLAHRPTPLERAPRLAAALQMDDDALWIKRDDCTGLAGGGNKVRKLEYLCADALAQGCKPPSTPTGNVVLDLVLGPRIEWAGHLDYVALEAAIDDVAARLRAAGKRPYAMPIGGASVVGEQGYVACAAELPDDVDLVVTAVGSGGTHAGLAAGLGDHAKVLGIDVGARTDPAEAVAAGAAAAAEYAGLASPVGTPQVDSSHVGAGYAVPTAEGREAVDLAARTEALLLDPVYTGKAMAGLVAARRAGRIERGTSTVFLHTGGLPALFAYADWVAG